jgi:hypothetical protein
MDAGTGQRAGALCQSLAISSATLRPTIPLHALQRALRFREQRVQHGSKPAGGLDVVAPRHEQARSAAIPVVHPDLLLELAKRPTLQQPSCRSLH